jgi:hypothetical protein
MYKTWSAFGKGNVGSGTRYDRSSQSYLFPEAAMSFLIMPNASMLSLGFSQGTRLWTTIFMPTLSGCGS